MNFQGKKNKSIKIFNNNKNCLKLKLKENL